MITKKNSKRSNRFMRRMNLHDLRIFVNNLDINEAWRRVRRCTDNKISYRKLFLIIFSIAILILYILPKFLFNPENYSKDPLVRCLDDRLTPFYLANYEFDAYIQNHPIQPSDKDFLIPYVGNGIFGLEIQEDSHLNIKGGRGLILPVYFHPIVSLSSKNGDFREATVTEFQTGIVHRFQCFDGFDARYLYYAHRNNPSVFVQEIQVTNTKNQLIDVELTLPRISDWPQSTSRVEKLQHGSSLIEFQVNSGYVELKSARQSQKSKSIRVISIVTRIVPRTLTLRKRGTTKLELLTTINYSDPIPLEKLTQQKPIVEKNAIEAMKKSLLEAQHNENGESAYYNFRQQHTKVWNKLWETGFYISTSKAENALNGDKINATIYAVLSQVRAYEFEESITPQRKLEIARDLTYAEGCFDSYHTLQADNLWKDMNSLEDLNSLVQIWLLTLEKQGCHNLLKAGASGIIQAMVLSFGGFRFSNQHLEFNIHPKFLHRDYLFRRLNYGNMTHVNVSVTVREDNKAELEVALDRSDESYYACDGGCLDLPVKLEPHTKKIFPVKLTEPLTAILYITTDKQHMEDLRHAIHVREVVEAPAHEHHVIALHKFGNYGLPTLFWVSICLIIIIFHVFLIKLIVKEYCEPPDKIRYRYLSKP